MALIVLLTLGSAIGWLAAILMRQDSVRQSFKNIAIGAAGAATSHVLTGEGIGSATIGPESLISGAFGAALFIAMATVLGQRLAR